MLKVIRFISLVVIALAILCAYSYLIFQLARDKVSLGPFTNPLKEFVTFPSTVEKVLTSNELAGIPEIYEVKDADFEHINRLDYDLYGLNAFWNIELKRWDIRLFNLRNDSVIYEWHLGKERLDFKSTEWQFANAEPRHCLLAEDKSLILFCNETNNLLRLDSNSNFVWHNTDYRFHHCMNPDPDGNLWICATKFVDSKNFDNRVKKFREDYLVLVDSHTGKTVFKKSMSDIFIENNYKNFVYGTVDDDPYHLNDIQPAMTDSRYWKKGDLFLSLRHKSMIFLYRPSSGKIIRLIFGPFMHQHDVHIISDHEICFFNNNQQVWRSIQIEPNRQSTDGSEKYSNMIIYNFEDTTFRAYFQQLFIDEKIVTKSQGMQEFLSNGDIFVESQNSGKVYVFNDEKVLLRKVFDSGIENFIERPHWIRIYESLNSIY